MRIAYQVKFFNLNFTVQIPKPKQGLLDEIKENIRDIHSIPIKNEGNKNQTNFLEDLNFPDKRNFFFIFI